MTETQSDFEKIRSTLCPYISKEEWDAINNEDMGTLIIQHFPEVGCGFWEPQFSIPGEVDPESVIQLLEKLHPETKGQYDYSRRTSF